jgi:ATP-dependent Clp protease, protease subunit
MELTMNKHRLPKALLDKWNPSLRVQNKSNTIELLDVIGFDYYDGGITAKTISDKLESFDGEDITVVINSPGGDMFEGIAIMNQLKQYKGKVHIDVIGLAASAASVIMMAGNTVKIADSAFVMIHNAWTAIAGDRNEFARMSEYLKPFDDSMANLYSQRTGIDKSEIAAMMDKETWFNGKQAIESKFADALLDDEIVESKLDTNLKALRELEASLRERGYSRSEAKNLLNELKGKTGSADDDTRDAVDLQETLDIAFNLTNFLKVK